MIFPAAGKIKLTNLTQISIKTKPLIKIKMLKKAANNKQSLQNPKKLIPMINSIKIKVS